MTEETIQETPIDDKNRICTEGWTSIGRGTVAGGVATLIGFACGMGTGILPWAALVAGVSALYHYGLQNGHYNKQLSVYERPLWADTVDFVKHGYFTVDTRITEVSKNIGATGGLIVGALGGSALVSYGMHKMGMTPSADFAGAAQFCVFKAAGLAAGGLFGQQFGGMLGTALAPFAHSAVVLKKRFL